MRLPKGITSSLLRWFARHRRALPWRTVRDPYRTWVSEVILQQTRVGQAVPVFERFLARFPDVARLARSTEEEVLKVWEGAGYYARARNLRRAALRIARSSPPDWPSTPEAWEGLPGVGRYTAAAIASIAFGAPVVALEANGRRIAARWTVELGEVRSLAVSRRLEEALTRLLPSDRPGEFNEALMELGETVCLPKKPRCPVCPVAAYCGARQALPDPGSIPLRLPREARPRVIAAVVAVERLGRWLVHRRPERGLLGGLWELPGGKLRPGEAAGTAARRELFEETGVRLTRLRSVGTVRHSYSHFSVELHVFRASLLRATHRRPRARSLRWVTRREFERLPRPLATVKAMRLVLDDRAPARVEP